MGNRQISENEKKQILLEIMDELDEYCIEHGLSYFLVGGTLLGAVRHKGFIPWDDDIDIGLKRNDYEKLVKGFKSKSGNIEIVYTGNTCNYTWTSAKAIHNKTLLIESGHEKCELGIFVDVFPFDYIEGSYKEAKKVVRKSNLWKSFLALKYLRLERRRSLVKNFIVLIGKALYIFSDRYLIEKTNSYGQKERNNATKYICNLSGVWGIRELAKVEDFDSTIKGYFEGREYLLPVGFDDYLQTVYGDYMALPPVEKRISHHVNVAYWKEVEL